MQDLSNKAGIAEDQINEFGKNFFIDVDFQTINLSETQEKIFAKIQTEDLIEAREEFLKLSNSLQVDCIRYIFSHRIFESAVLEKTVIHELKEKYKESYGSLCSEKPGQDNDCHCIDIESEIITRVLYLTESLEDHAFEVMSEILKDVDQSYEIIIEVIKERRNFHNQDI